MIESLFFIASYFSSNIDSDDYDLGANFRGDTVDIELEIRHPGGSDGSRNERSSGGGTPGDAGSPGGGSGGGPENGSHDDGGTASPDGEQSFFYCVGATLGMNADCLNFQGALPQLGRSVGCVLGQTISGTPESSGAAPQELCLEDVPEPEVEQALIEETVAETESEWEQILIQIPGEVERTFASLPIDGGVVSFEPELQGFGYVNRHTNVFVDTESQTFTETLLGIEVEVRAIPVEHRFDYGDGTVRTLHEPGGPGAQLGTTEDTETLADMETPTSHVYQETGVYPVGVTSTFIGEYRLPGGTWTPVAGSAEVPASPGEADIWRIDHRHVADECFETGHWGCSGPVELGPGDQPPAVFADQYDDAGRYLGP